MKRGAIFFGLLCLLACGKKEPPPPQAVVPAAPVKPWTCEILNGVLVVRGEVDRPVDLILEGRSIRQTHHAHGDSLIARKSTARLQAKSMGKQRIVSHGGMEVEWKV